MAARGIDPNNFKYYPPNFSGDIRERKPYILLGSFNKRPMPAAWDQESIRVLVIKANFESKEVLYKLGNIAVDEKIPSNRYDWKVIKVSVQALYQERWGGFKITCYLLFAVPVAISLGLVSIELLLTFSKRFSSDNDSPLIMLLIAIGTFHTLKYFVDYFKQNFLPLIEQAQKPYLDQFVAFQKLDQIPHSMRGFDPRQLANETTATGWINPITQSVILRNQITSAQILRIGQYALPIIDALKVMLQNPCSKIHHPISDDHLTSEEKSKFLHEVSSFFGISDPKDLKACWKQRVSIGEVLPFISRVPYLDFLPDTVKLSAIMSLHKQLLINKQKQAFLKLLPQSIAEEYFDDQFRLEQIIIPDPAGQNLLLRLHPAELATLCLIILSEVGRRLQQN